MKTLVKSMLFAAGALCLGTQAHADPFSDKEVRPNETQLIFLLNDEAYGVDVADQAVLAVSPERARSGLRGRSSELPQLAWDLGSPKKLDYLINTDRLTNEMLAKLPKDDPDRLLHQYVVATYDAPSDVNAVYRSASSQVQQNTSYALRSGWDNPNMPIKFVEKDITFGYSAIPNDVHYSGKQRGMMRGVMRFEQAWNYTTGYAKLGMIDSGIEEAHPEFRHDSNKFNYLKRYSANTDFNGSLNYGNANDFFQPYRGHGTHVAGIMVAAVNNGYRGREGVAGVCHECAFVVNMPNDKYFDSGLIVSKAVRHLVSTGAVAINMSFGTMEDASCQYRKKRHFCEAVRLAKKYNVQLVAASGNGYRKPNFYPATTMEFPASNPHVLSVGAIDGAGNRMNFSDYYSQMGSGSNQVDVMAYGVNVFSTFYRGFEWIEEPYAGGKTCTESADSYVGYGYCTGTSMATPFITGLVGLMRSADPYLTNDQIKSKMTSYGNYTQRTNGGFTYKIPNAENILRSILGPSKNKRVPLINLYSSVLKDNVYVIAPQAAAAASYYMVYETRQSYELTGKVASGNYPIEGYQNRRGSVPAQGNAYVYTTKNNPEDSKSYCQMVPLYRLNSWRPGNADHTYATSMAEINMFTNRGYKYEGIEGYIFPKHDFCKRPSKTVRLMRKYNRTLNDHAIFPENQLSLMQSKGYTENSGSDWLGYVYPL